MPIASDLRQEPGAGKPHAGICAGGRRQLLSLPRRAPGEAGAIQPVEREGGSARPVASVAGSSATMVLKRTQRDDEDCIEPRKTLTVEAEALRTAAGNMCGTVLRGTVAPPESETSSSRQGSCRNLGDLQPPAAALAVPGRFGKARSRSRIGRLEESDGCRVPMKPRTTSADRLMTESVEGRRPVEGRARANACPGHRAGPGMSPTACTHGPELDGPPKPRMSVASDLRQEPGAGKPHAGICAGGRRQLLSLPQRRP